MVASKFLLPFLAVALLLWAPPVFSQETQETPERERDAVTEIPTDNQDPEQLAAEAARTVSETKRDIIFEKVEELRKKFVESRYEHTTRTLRQLSEALVDDEATFDLYIECVRELKFTRMNRPAIDFINWRKENIAFMRSREHKQALRLQLLHMMAAIRAGLAKDIRDAFPAADRWIEYYMEVESSLSYPRMDNRRDSSRVTSLVGVGMFSTDFAKYFDLKKVVVIPNGWPMSSTDVDGFFANVLLPICRETGDWPGISKGWDVRLSSVRAIAADREERQDKLAWEAIMERWYPQLLWERAIDKIAFGPDPEEGLKDAYQVIHNYFDHDEMPRWISRLTLLIKPPLEEEGSGVGNETLASLLASLRPPEPPKVIKDLEEEATIEEPEIDLEQESPTPPPAETD